MSLKNNLLVLYNLASAQILYTSEDLSVRCSLNIRDLKSFALREIAIIILVSLDNFKPLVEYTKNPKNVCQSLHILVPLPKIIISDLQDDIKIHLLPRLNSSYRNNFQNNILAHVRTYFSDLYWQNLIERQSSEFFFDKSILYILEVSHSYQRISTSLY